MFLQIQNDFCSPCIGIIFEYDNTFILEHLSLQYENPWTIPNILCMARIVLSPVLGYLIVEQYFYTSLGLFAFAGATDLVRSSVLI